MQYAYFAERRRKVGTKFFGELARPPVRGSDGLLFQGISTGDNEVGAASV